MLTAVISRKIHQQLEKWKGKHDKVLSVTDQKHGKLKLVVWPHVLQKALLIPVHEITLLRSSNTKTCAHGLFDVACSFPFSLLLLRNRMSRILKCTSVTQSYILVHHFSPLGGKWAAIYHGQVRHGVWEDGLAGKFSCLRAGLLVPANERQTDSAQRLRWSINLTDINACKYMI